MITVLSGKWTNKQTKRVYHITATSHTACSLPDLDIPQCGWCFCHFRSPDDNSTVPLLAFFHGTAQQWACPRVEQRFSQFSCWKHQDDLPWFDGEASSATSGRDVNHGLGQRVYLPWHQVPGPYRACVCRNGFSAGRCYGGRAISVTLMFSAEFIECAFHVCDLWRCWLNEPRWW